MTIITRLIVIILSLLSTLLFSGCATTRTYGNNVTVNEEILAQIHAGTSTTNDLRQLLGAPTEIESMGANIELWTYRYIEYQGAYLPLLGQISTGNEQESTIKFYIHDNLVDRLERLHTKRSSGL